MSYKPQSSFSAGEYDPALWERTTIQKRDSGLSKLRGFFVGKTGRLISMPGSTYDNVTRKLAGRKVVTYYPPFSDYEIEVGHEYIRIHNLISKTFVEVTVPSHPLDIKYYQEEDLERLHFASDKTHVYIFHPKYTSKKILLGTVDPDGSQGLNVRVDNVVWEYASPIGLNMTITPFGPGGSPTGYEVQYTASVIINGQESGPTGSNFLNGKLPIDFDENNLIKIQVPPRSKAFYVSRINVYRRPKGGGAWGFIGSSDVFTDPSAILRVFEFTDVGGAADFSHQPPQYSQDFFDDIETAVVTANPSPPPATITTFGNSHKFPTGTIYQQRLCISGQKDLEAIFTSRIRYKNSFLAETYSNSESALALKAGTTGRAQVLRLFDAGPLVAFTTAGVYANSSSLALDFNNVGMTRKGNWVIDEMVAPLSIPGGFLFVEKSTGAIIQFTHSTELDSFTGGEITIYSNHLFEGKRVKSWAYQSGLTPVIWVVMDDGTVNVLTYLPEQEMKAWSWMDTDGKYETVGVHQRLDGVNDVYFTVLRNGIRVREKLAERFNVEFKDYIGCHSAKVFKTRMTGTVDATQLIGATYSLVGDPGTFANTAGNGAVGSQFRFFTKSGTPITFQVTAYVGTNEVTVLSIDDREIPADELNDLVIYKVFTTVTGLGHLEGKQVYVKNDGFIESNPLTKTFEGQNRYGTKTVVGGQITLDNPGAIVIVGLPMVNDARLLEVDTVEQQPALLASVTLNKVELTYYRSRGVHTSYDFPDDDTTTGMTDSESYIADDMTIQAAEVPLLPYSKRVEIIDVGSWDSHGQFAMRHVDGHPIEILSVISDLDVLRKRGN